MHIIDELTKKKLISPPSFVKNLILLNTSGSNAYGISTDLSDHDIVGIAIHDPTLIPFYDNIPSEFQEHHVKDGDKEYDIKIYSIGKFFKLAMEGNPNIMDFILTDKKYSLYEHPVGKKLRDFAPNFCSKNSCSKYFGFAENHFRTIQRKKEDISQINPKRQILYQKYGFDTKDAGHCVRAILCLEEMLKTGSYSVEMEPHFIKDIRNGVYTLDEIIEFVDIKKEQVSKLEQTSLLQAKPNSKMCEIFLRSCIEEYFDGV